MSVGDYITRSEFEARHSELRTELIRLSTENDAHFNWVVNENEKIRKDVQIKFDSLVEKIDSARVSTWKAVALSSVNFILGGGLVGLLTYLHFPR